MLIWGPSEPQRCRRPPTLSLYYVGKIKETIFSETSCANKGQQQLATMLQNLFHCNDYKLKTF